MNSTPMIALLRQAESRPQATAFVFGDDVWTYERLVTQSGRLARGLTRFGLRKGDHVALHMTNRPEMLVAYYACFQLGVIAAPMWTDSTLAEISRLLERLQPALYLGEVALYNKIAAMDDSKLPFQRRFVFGGIVEDFRVENWQKLFDNDPDARLSTAVDVNAPAVLVTTSGTTGEPKLVTHTLATLSGAAEMTARNLGFEADDILIGQMSFTHVAGIISFLIYIHLGAPFVLLNTFDSDVVLDTIEQYRCTVLPGFPISFASLVDRQLARPRNLQSLRICLTSSDVCPDTLRAQVSAVFGVSLFNFWSATEAVGTLTYGLQSGSVSRIADGAQIRLIDDDGVEVRRGETGELCVRGPNVFVGYWNQPAATSEVLKDGWYHTGDLMRHGSGNDLWFVGRKRDIIIRGGLNISPVEVGNALLRAHPSVQEAAVVGVPDAVLGQRLFGFVRLARGVTDSIVGDILTATAELLTPDKIPERLAVIDQLPRNARGKVDRGALAKMALHLYETDATSPSGEPAHLTTTSPSSARNEHNASQRK